MTKSNGFHLSKRNTIYFNINLTKQSAKKVVDF